MASRPLLWAVLIAPLALQTWWYLSELVYYGEYLHWTGVQSARLLLVTLAVTPLLRLLPRQAVVRWLMARRRDLGLITFVYALAHTVAYLVYFEQKAGWRTIVRDGLEFELLTGWLAMAVFVALAVTSNDASVRAMGRAWNRLHRAVYVAAILTFAHWVLTAFDPIAGYLHAGVLAVLLGMRLRAKS